jgi:hypothetical protein
MHVADHEMKEFIGDQIDPGTSRLAIQRKPYVSFYMQSNLY